MKGSEVSSILSSYRTSSESPPVFSTLLHILLEGIFHGASDVGIQKLGSNLLNLNRIEPRTSIILSGPKATSKFIIPSKILRFSSLEEEVNLLEYLKYQGVYECIGQFLNNVYMHKWIHSALGHLRSGEFKEECQDAQIAEERIN